MKQKNFIKGDKITVCHQGQLVDIPIDNYNDLNRHGHLRWMGYSLPVFVESSPYIQLRSQHGHNGAIAGQTHPKDSVS